MVKLYIKKSGSRFFIDKEKGLRYFHRLNGPAAIYSHGQCDWYYNDVWSKCKSQEEFKRFIKLLIFK
jgi:hypothetical protein